MLGASCSIQRSSIDEARAQEKALSCLDEALSCSLAKNITENRELCKRRTMLDLSDTYMALPVFVHEFMTHAVDPAAIDEPELLDKRACLYRIPVPPDALNPQVRFLIFAGRASDCFFTSPEPFKPGCTRKESTSVYVT